MSELMPKFERRLEDQTLGPKQLPTAGAIQTKNAKGDIVMMKVKVNRYIAGQAPKYSDTAAAEASDSGDEDELGKLAQMQRHDAKEREDRQRSGDRPRESRFSRGADDKNRRGGGYDRRDRQRHNDTRRHIEAPEIIRKSKRNLDSTDSDSDEAAAALSAASDGDDAEPDADRERRRIVALRRRREREREEEAPLQYEDPDEEDNENEIQRRREDIRKQKRNKEGETNNVQTKTRDSHQKSSKSLKQEEIFKREKEELLEEEEESSDDETEESDTSDEESAQPLLKPVFVKKRDRVTLMEAEEEEKRLEQLKIEDDKRKDERKRESVKIMEDVLKREEESKKIANEDLTDLTAVDTDDENEEVAYELWKIREMKRLKRNRDEREALAKEKNEIDRIHGMNEEERAEYLRKNPKIITNKAEKGKYTFLQKYYHRGAFFLDQEDDVLKRDFAVPTGEDEFDKSILPKVMQVKNFGKASRSKHTHLTDVDTSQVGQDYSPWTTETAISARFNNKQAGGSKNIFERPAYKKRKVD